MMRFMTLLLALVMMAGVLSACGRKGDPEEPPGTTYPRQYPSQ